MQNSKSYEDLKAELGNSGDWGQITAVSMGQVAGAPTFTVGPHCPFTVVRAMKAQKAPEKVPGSSAFFPSFSPSSPGGSSYCLTSMSCADLFPPFPSEVVPKFYHV